jgi:hypothetical protein
VDRMPVSSSNLASVGYDAETLTLEIEFLGGREYQYYEVPPGEYQGLMTAASHGTYFNEHIKNAYRCARV